MPHASKKLQKPSPAVAAVLQQQVQAKVPKQAASEKPKAPAPAGFNFRDIRIHPGSERPKGGTDERTAPYLQGQDVTTSASNPDVDKTAADELTHTMQQTPQREAADIATLPVLLDEQVSAPATVAELPAALGGEKTRIADLAADALAPVLKQPFNLDASRAQRDSDINKMRGKLK